jgi:hypothetical protein
MARQNNGRDTSPILSAAEFWKNECLVSDGSLSREVSLDIAIG